jgi:hypothetical protein
VEESTSVYAEEGRKAHEEAAKCLLSHTTSEDEDIQYYLDYVAEQKAGASTMFIEQQVDFEKFAPGGFGTIDCVIVAPPVLKIIDLKFGKGVKIDASFNYQLMIYALAVYDKLAEFYDFSSVKLCICQPRIDHIDEWEISATMLAAFGRDLAVTVGRIERGEVEYTPSEKACRWCSIKATCRARAEADIISDFRAELTNEEISGILKKASEIIAWVSDVKEHALKQAMAGVKFAGFKLVEGRSNRVWAPNAEELLKDKEEMFEKKLIGITKAQKIMDIGPYVTKPKGAPVLVPDDDKRKEMKGDFDEGSN